VLGNTRWFAPKSFLAAPDSSYATTIRPRPGSGLGGGCQGSAGVQPLQDHQLQHPRALYTPRRIFPPAWFCKF